MNELFRKSDCISRSVSAENFTGEKGKGGMATEGLGKNAARDLGRGWKVSPCVEVKPGETFCLADIKGQGMIRHIWIVDSRQKSRGLVLRMYWDGADAPSVAVPLGDFFASALYEDFKQLSSCKVCVNPRNGFNSYWEMPFYKEARLTVENITEQSIIVYFQIDYTLETLPEDCLYFHAQFRRVNPLPYKENYTILEGVSGKGQYVGTYLLWGVNNSCWWGEGEIKFYLDGDTEYPTICGTGTEDYFCGAYDFDLGPEKGYTEFNTPYTGMRMYRSTDTYRHNVRFGLYRWHTADPVFFDEDIRVTIQALGWRGDGRYLPLQDDISSVAYFYLDTPVDVQGTLPDADGLEII